MCAGFASRRRARKAANRAARSTISDTARRGPRAFQRSPACAPTPRPAAVMRSSEISQPCGGTKRPSGVRGRSYTQPGRVIGSTSPNMAGSSSPANGCLRTGGRLRTASLGRTGEPSTGREVETDGQTTEAEGVVREFWPNQRAATGPTMWAVGRAIGGWVSSRFVQVAWRPLAGPEPIKHAPRDRGAAWLRDQRCSCVAKRHVMCSSTRLGRQNNGLRLLTSGDRAWYLPHKDVSSSLAGV